MGGEASNKVIFFYCRWAVAASTPSCSLWVVLSTHGEATYTDSWVTNTLQNWWIYC